MIEAKRSTIFNAGACLGLLLSAVVGTGRAFAEATTNDFPGTLPDGMTTEAVVALVSPPAKAPLGKPTVVAVKPWRRMPGLWIAVACCDAQKHYRLGIFHWQRPGQPERIATGDFGFEAGDWNPGAWLSGKNAAVAEPRGTERLSGFDVSPFELTSGDYAFGVRTSESEGFAGGGHSVEHLHLYRVHGDSLELILNIPTSEQSLIAGEWNEDGSRDHRERNVDRILLVDQTKTAGINDFLVRERGGDQLVVRFQWDPKLGAYKPRIDADLRAAIKKSRPRLAFAIASEVKTINQLGKAHRYIYVVRNSPKSTVSILSFSFDIPTSASLHDLKAPTGWKILYDLGDSMIVFSSPMMTEVSPGQAATFSFVSPLAPGTVKATVEACDQDPEHGVSAQDHTVQAPAGLPPKR